MEKSSRLYGAGWILPILLRHLQEAVGKARFFSRFRRAGRERFSEDFRFGGRKRQ
jgi:hypothetical protein